MRSPLLPPPRLAPVSQKPRAADIAAVAGEDLTAPLRERDRLLAESQALVADLQDHRPGGDGWAEALAADRATALEGKAPKVLATERLLTSDAHRWAVASAACRSLAERQRVALDGLDLPAIASAAWTAAGEAEAAWSVAVVDAWNVRQAGGSRGQQTVGYEATREPLKRWSLAAGVWRWARADTRPTAEQAATLEALRWGFPGGDLGRAFWLMRAEQEQAKPLTVPAHVADASEVRLTAEGRHAHATTVAGGVS